MVAQAAESIKQHKWLAKMCAQGISTLNHCFTSIKSLQSKMFYKIVIIRSIYSCTLVCAGVLYPIRTKKVNKHPQVSISTSFIQ